MGSKKKGGKGNFPRNLKFEGQAVKRTFFTRRGMPVGSLGSLEGDTFNEGRGGEEEKRFALEAVRLCCLGSE